MYAKKTRPVFKIVFTHRRFPNGGKEESQTARKNEKYLFFELQGKGNSRSEFYLDFLVSIFFGWGIYGEKLLISPPYPLSAFRLVVTDKGKGGRAERRI